MKRIRDKLKKWRGTLNYHLIKLDLFGFGNKWHKVNICGGGNVIPGYANIDLSPKADVNLDLEKKLLPFKENSIEIAVCISAINYFSRARGEKIIKDTYRILKTEGVARFGVQDLRSIAQRYVNNDRDFFFQKLPSGKDRFQGETVADKINSWFYGYETTGRKRCKYFYDFETLSLLFKKAGFKTIEKKCYRESIIEEVNFIDNREDQMFFLEAVK